MMLYFMTIWNMLRPFGIIFAIWYSLWSFVIIFPVLVFLDEEKSGNPANNHKCTNSRNDEVSDTYILGDSKKMTI
jgi:hypothetical protein